MPLLTRVRVVWSGLPSGPGYSNFHFAAPGDSWLTDAQEQACIDRLDTFVSAVSNNLPSTVRLKVDGNVERIASTTGELTGYGVRTTLPERVGGVVGNYAAPTGMVVNWLTDMVRKGRRLRGRTFIVPIASSRYDTNGTVNDDAVRDIGNAANALRTAPATEGQLFVFGRPTLKGLADGVAAPVTGVRVPDKAIILTSRR